MTPTKNNPEIARRQFEEDIELVLKHPYAEYFDWKIEYNVEELHANVGLWAFDESHNKLDDFHIVMNFEYYRTNPPGVMFVNPETRKFDKSVDLRWLPALASHPPGLNIAFHPSYDGYPDGISRQLVCNSTVLEYYISNHSPTEDERWDPTRHNLFATLSTLQMTLKKPYYGGKMS